jgi:hypothetical protein
MKKKFEIKPKDLKSWKYWVHLGVISIIVLGLLQLLFGGKMFTFGNIILSTILIGVADITAHTILQID